MFKVFRRLNVRSLVVDWNDVGWGTRIAFDCRCLS